MTWIADITALAGASLVILGISLWSVPAALVVGGLGLVALGLASAKAMAWRRRRLEDKR